MTLGPRVASQRRRERQVGHAHFFGRIQFDPHGPLNHFAPIRQPPPRHTLHDRFIDLVLVARQGLGFLVRERLVDEAFGQLVAKLDIGFDGSFDVDRGNGCRHVRCVQNRRSDPPLCVTTDAHGRTGSVEIRAKSADRSSSVRTNPLAESSMATAPTRQASANAAR